MGHSLTNWAGNHAYGAARLHRPGSIDELRSLLARGERVKVLGTRHAFNDIADTDGDHVSLERFDRLIGLDRGRVTLEAGVTYGALCRYLNDAGYALRNLASLPHISVAGACATATHGSGDGNGNLATAVAAVELMTADGQLRTLSRERDGGDTFNGAVVSLGGLGIVTRLTLDVVPAFQVRQEVYENLPLAALLDRFDQITSLAYSVSVFTGWRGEAVNQVWLKRRAGDGDDDGDDGKRSRMLMLSLGATPAANNVHPIAGMPAENCTQQLGVPGPWHERLPHFRMEFTPSAGEELQSEYFVPRDRAAEALRATDALRERIAPLLLISEIRTIAADELWMSPCYRRASAAIHFTWRGDWPGVRAVLPAIESALQPFDARPHWGKLFTMPTARLAGLYPRMEDFRGLLHDFDPRGTFRNPFLARCIAGLL